LVEALIHYAEAQDGRPVLFYQEDSSLLLVSRYRERLSHAFRFVVPDAELVEQLVDKTRFQELAAFLGLPVPAACVLRPADESPPDDLGVRFPLVVKPLARLSAGWEAAMGAGKAVRVDSADQLLSLWPRLVATGSTVLAQELIPGPETNVESYHTYVDERGQIVADFTGRKIRTAPASFGHSTAVEITDQPDISALGREIVCRLGLRGVAKLDFKRDPDNSLYLLEVNPRFTLWHHAGAIAGVNVPALVYGDLVGWPRGTVPRARAGVRWCRLWTDVRAARAEGVPLFKWLPWALRCKAKPAVSPDDPLPLLAAALWRGTAGIRRRKRESKLNIHDIHAIFMRRFRAPRMREFARLFDLKESDKVIDVGGTRGNWEFIPIRPNVLLVNLDGEEWEDGRIRKVRGDGTSLAYPDQSFDIAYSNSVIEHVGGWSEQSAFAREISRLAPRYYVQTPNRWFFLEPHLLAPFLHFLPRRVTRRLARYLSVWGWVTKPDQKTIDSYLANIRLLGVKEMKRLFPGAEIHREKFLGMTKSIIAIRL
jgi:predicted ATP-grasp superfamily ATP-dependent carboligase